MLHQYCKIEHKNDEKENILRILKLNEDIYKRNKQNNIKPNNIKPIIKMTMVKTISECLNLIKNYQIFNQNGSGKIIQIQKIMQIFNIALYFINKNVEVPAQYLQYVIDGISEERNILQKSIENDDKNIDKNIDNQVIL